MGSAYTKAGHVARIAKGAAAAQKRHGIMQQQQSSLAGPSCRGWPTTGHLKQKPTASSDGATRSQAAVVSSPCQGSVPVAPRLGKPPTFKKLPSSKSPAPSHGRLSSHEPALADQQPQPLSRRPSTAAGRAGPPKWRCHAGRPVTVDCAPLRGSHGFAVADSPGKPQAGTSSTESAAALSANPAQESSSPGSSSRGRFPPRKTPEKAESGSLDAALQRRQNTPDEAWSAALSAAALGVVQGPERSRPLKIDSPRHDHTCLTPTNILCFAQGDLSSSSASSPAVSPRPPSRAIDFIPGLKARCAVADSSSPGITPRPVVHSSDLGVARFEGHPVYVADEHENLRERSALLAARLAAQAAPETQSRISITASNVKVTLQHQMGMPCGG